MKKSEADANNIIDKFYYGEEKGKMFYNINNYKSDWNLLMKVVAKINQTGLGEERFDVIIWKWDCHINDKHQIIFEASGNPVINAVWEAVLKFCKWYNKKSK